MARNAPAVRQPRNLMQAFDDSLASHSYVSTGPEPIAPRMQGSTDAGASIPGPTTKQQAEQERMYQEGVKRQKNAGLRFIKKNPFTST